MLSPSSGSVVRLRASHILREHCIRFSSRNAAYSLDNTIRGYGINELQRYPPLQENYEYRIRTRTPEYLEFFPVP